LTAQELKEGLGGEGFFPHMHLLKELREYLTLCPKISIFLLS
jgi:hypothetical protein